MTHLARKLKTRRVEQRRLAEVCGVSPSTVSQWVSGDRTPTLHHSLVAAKLLKCPVETLYQVKGGRLRAK